jgi:lysophospholipase L1-like esterase
MSRLRVPALLVLASILALASTGPALAAKPVKRPAQQLYVSLGDSYAAGYQPTAVGVGATTTNGFAYQLPAAAKKRGYDLKLVNFGCGGATTTSIITTVGCPPNGLGPGGIAYPTTTQAVAAEAYVKAHRKRIGLITVSIGGNDVTACGRGDADPIACVGAAVTSIKTNVTALVTGLRKAAGPKVKIVGITYPDVILGDYLTGNPSLATLSVTAFKSLINPALQQSYAAGKAGFVDVTAATGAYGSMDETTDLAPYGTIPTPVAKVCQLTYFCEFGDIHARTGGYGLIAGLIAQTLPRRRS